MERAQQENEKPSKNPTELFKQGNARNALVQGHFLTVRHMRPYTVEKMGRKTRMRSRMEVTKRFCQYQRNVLKILKRTKVQNK